MASAAMMEWLHSHHDDLSRFADVLRLRDGRSLTVRFVEPRDRAGLQAYFAAMAPAARYNRFTGASSGLSGGEFDRLLQLGEGDRYAVVAEMTIDGATVIVGEARYMYDEAADRVEFGLSVGDAFRGLGIGFALLSNLECRAAALGAHHLMGDTLGTNIEMQSLGRKAGFHFTRTPGDWREVRLLKEVHPVADIPCASWRDFATESQTGRIDA
ncbi:MULTISPECIES: GNAT family N-acetyltransferase [unclassified Bradyrhizobium]|uniref:GNAT family N-acetyltransferase n=1 Tax=unclassified Bradyrhizobium TaxID=2631580 RepID=UPI002011C9EF|nr:MULTISPECIES: GNAT family N-acetyltransferase [unclassified Bradyrhizobium]